MPGRARAVALAAALVGWSATAGLELPGRRHPLVQAGLGTALAVATRAPLGLQPSALRSGLRWGVAAASVIGATVAAGTSLPVVRGAMADRTLPAPAWKWLTVSIPLGTVWSEELAFRGALATAAARGFGPSCGRLLQAGAFGLSHIADARGTGDPVLPTVLVTGVAGWAFALLAERSGSVLASALAHLAINEAGAVAALAVQRGTGISHI